MVQDLRILEMLDEGVQPLQTRIGQGADLNRRKEYLFTLELAPTFALEAQIKFLQAYQIQEIDEPVPYIAVILDIARQVKEIV